MKKTFALLAFLSILLLLPFVGGAEQTPESLNLSMLDQHGAIMLLTDAETGAIVYANNAAIAFYGYSGEQLLSMNITQINTLSREKTLADMQAAREQQESNFILQHKLSSGEIKTVEEYSYPVEANGRTLLFSIIHDISEKTLLAQKQNSMTTLFFLAGGAVIAALILLTVILFRSRRKLKEAKSAFEYSDALRKTFIDADDSMIYLKDENLKYAFVNHAVETFYNRSSDQLVGHTDFDLTEKTFADRRRATDLKALESNAVATDEVEWNDRVFKTLKFPVPLPNGKVGVGAYISDITVARKNEKKHEQALIRHKALADMYARSFADGQEQIDYVLNQARNLTDSRYGYLCLYDEEKRQFSVKSRTKGAWTSCDDIEMPDRMDLDQAGLWGEAVRKKNAVIINGFDGPSPFVAGLAEGEGRVPLEKFMSVPVTVDEKIIAVVGLANKKSDYDEDDVYHTIMLLGGAWNAIVRRETREKLSLERNRYQQTLLSIGDGVMVVDINGRIEMLNAVAQELVGWSQEEARGKQYQDVFVLSREQAGQSIQDPVERALALDHAVEMENHAVLTSRNGTRYYLEDSAAPVKDESGTTLGVVLVFRNVTEKKEQQQEIEFLSYHDALTGLYNRRFFEEEVSRLDTRRNLPVSLIIGDVNNLKLTNDVFGHAYGDLLLKSLAGALGKVCRADDIIARWGGDEFALLLPKTGLAEAQQIIARIRDEFGKVRIKAVNGSVSMGAAAKLQESENIRDTVDKAEEEMYLRKSLEHDEIMKGTLDTILRLLHDASPREKEHAAGVSQLCQAMGRRLHMAEAEVKKLQDAGFMHDIGKIVLDGKLLSNKYTPSAKEWNEIKRHPVIGYRILNTYDDMLDLAQIVLTHQERWDGSGYPKGLKGDQIPRESRIIALVESYERKVHGADNVASMSKEEALEAIKNNKGKHFDPELTDVFIAMMQEGGPDTELA